MKIERIVGTYSSNTFVVGDQKQVLIIDSGADLAAVLAVVGKRRVLAILVTHEHFDHLTNCVTYAKHFNAPIYGTREVLDNLKYYKAELPSEEEIGVVYPIAVYDPAVTFHVIADEQPIVIEGITVQPYVCQGHSAGSVVYLIEGNLFTGDLLFERGIGNIFMTNGKRYIVESLARVKDLPFKMAYHGHGAPSNYADQIKNVQVWLKWKSR